MTKVIVTGAAGKMGKEIIKAIMNQSDLQLVGAIDVCYENEDIGKISGIGECGIKVGKSLDLLFQNEKPDVLVDFTNAESAVNNMKLCLKHSVRPIIGTTGIPLNVMEELSLLFNEEKLGGILAPNFAIGAVLLMEMARQAAKYFEYVEIIELHHEKKLDAPSGTSLKTAELLLKERSAFNPFVNSQEKLNGVRGGEKGGIRIHSVRLPGLVAHQEVIFGGLGETLSIKHDSLSRESFMPGIIMAIKKVVNLNKFVYGLENLL